jgi:hypothetical protein
VNRLKAATSKAPSEGERFFPLNRTVISKILKKDGVAKACGLLLEELERPFVIRLKATVEDVPEQQIKRGSALQSRQKTRLV